MVCHIVEKYCILVWSILTTIVSSVGNCTVLIATIKYDAIKLDNISKVIKKLLSRSKFYISTTVFHLKFLLEFILIGIS